MQLTLPSDAAMRTFTPDAPAVLIDLRDPALFAQGHVHGACSLPLASLEARLFELPPPGEWQLSLLGSAEELAAAQTFLAPKGWTAEGRDTDDPATWAAAHQEHTRVPPPSPYRPNSFLSAVLDAAELPAAKDPGLAVDLGCGSGRDAVRSLTAETAR